MARIRSKIWSDKDIIIHINSDEAPNKRSICKGVDPMNKTFKKGDAVAELGGDGTIYRVIGMSDDSVLVVLAVRGGVKTGHARNFHKVGTCRKVRSIWNLFVPKWVFEPLETDIPISPMPPVKPARK